MNSRHTPKPCNKQLLYLWKTRSLFIGNIEKPLDISTGAATFMFGLQKPLRFSFGKEQGFIETNSLLLNAGADVIIDTQNSMIANCTLDAKGRDFTSLQKLMQKNIHHAYYDIQNEEHHYQQFLNIQELPLECHEVLRSLIKILNIDTNKSSSNAIDPRIELIIEQIQSKLCENPSFTELASLANISPSRLIQLFKQETGLPMRRYRLWCRLYETALNIGLGKSLTEAALDAGFTDSSHFNRTFRSMIGIAPRFIFSQAEQLHIILPNEYHNNSNHILQTCK